MPKLLTPFWIFLAVTTCLAQEFGGTPPWGLEQPVHLHGELHRGETFVGPISDDLSLIIESRMDGFKVMVAPTAGDKTGGVDFTRCVSPPFRGPNPTDIMAWHFFSKDFAWGVGNERWFYFALDGDAHEAVCRLLEDAFNRDRREENKGERDYAGNSNGVDIPEVSQSANLRGGMGRLKITNVQFVNSNDDQGQSIASLTFDAECSLYGGLELWRRPVHYLIPDDFTGWVTVYSGQKSAFMLPISKDHYVSRVNKSGTIRTSSGLRSDLLGTKFLSSRGKSLSTNGSGRGVRCWMAGFAGSPGSMYQTFFVGTSGDLERKPQNPLFPQLDCGPD